jgi:exopolyphosphatase/guanosine-5'-triphosphate,3'-diphosphate pyrophosphatase
MRVGVIDVGSNTIRLLAAEAAPGGIAAVRELKARVGLGAEVELHGRISSVKLAEAAATVRTFATEARELGCARLEIVVASPGRQAENAGRLIQLLARSTAAPVRVLSQEEEAHLAYVGALAVVRPTGRTVAVCDVGGGSTQIAFGEPGKEPIWLRSVDIGSLRLTTRLLHRDPPGEKAISAARAAVREEFAGLATPLPKAAYAVGGSARALRKLVGRALGADELGEAVSILRRTPIDDVVAVCGIDRERARTLTAGAIILAEVQLRLAVPLEVVRAGLREGLALTLLEERTALRPAAGERRAG